MDKTIEGSGGPDLYDPGHTSRYYDEYGAKEWERLVKNATNQVNFHIHQWYLRKYIHPRDRVLEAGAGPGRFTIELARLQAQVTVGDISPEQLALNRQKVGAADCENSVVDRRLLNIADLSHYETDHFDAVVCYGGPLSYMFDHFDQAMSELLRVTRPGGHVLFSVMSSIGTTRAFFPAILGQYRPELIEQVLARGDLFGELADNGHDCHMFRWSELKSLLERHACTIVDASAANFLSPGHEETLDDIARNNPPLWNRILDWEVNVCREPGAIDGGTHILAVVRKTQRRAE